jgi:hypothetical protein
MKLNDYVDQQLNLLSHQESLTLDQQRYESVLKAVKNDPSFETVVIGDAKVESFQDGGGGSAMFVNTSTKEAIISYRGTGKEEWKDNFIGGTKTDAADGVSTPYQEAALKTYREYTDDLGSEYTITVTGHSKGGNKAKYITILDDSVDRCISCDGQGFSDDFMNAYQSNIAHNQSKITNHNVDDDFVNLLLNDIGETVYYTNNRGKENITYNHYADAYFSGDETGNYTVNVTDRPKDVAQLDEFLNSFLRSMNDEERRNALELFGDIAATARHDGLDANNIMTLLLEDGNLNSASYLIAFLTRYEQEHPEFGKAIESYLNRNGLGDAVKIVQTVEGVMNHDVIKWLIDHPRLLQFGVDVLWKLIPSAYKDDLLNYLSEKLGLKLTQEQLFALIQAAINAFGYANTIEEIPDGKDIQIQSNYDWIYVNTDFLDAIAGNLKRLAQELEGFASQAKSIASDSAMDEFRFEVPFTLRFWVKRLMGSSGSMNVGALINRLSNSLSESASFATALSKAVDKTSEMFNEAENEIAGNVEF